MSHSRTYNFKQANDTAARARAQTAPLFAGTIPESPDSHYVAVPNGTMRDLLELCEQAARASRDRCRRNYIWGLLRTADALYTPRPEMVAVRVNVDFLTRLYYAAQ